MKRLLYVLTAGLMGAAIFAGCNDNEEATLVPTMPSDLEIAAIVNAGFNPNGAWKDVDGGLWIEGDYKFTVNQLKEMTPGVSVSEEHYRSTNIVGGTPRTITVYMDGQFNAEMQAAFDLALARYNALNLNVTFQRASSSGADIDIFAGRFRKYFGGTILGQSAGFPDAQGNPASPITLNKDVYSPKRGSIPADAATVIAHEIGHAIGFRHTDYMNRSYSCGTGGDEGAADVGAVYIPGTPSGPSANSWMLACSNGTDRPFTSSDQTALTTVY